MAKLPKKPANIVHEYFPVGADGHSPFNFLGPKDVDSDSHKGKYEIEKKITEKDDDQKKKADAWKNTNFPTMAFKKGGNLPTPENINKKKKKHDAKKSRYTH